MGQGVGGHRGDSGKIWGVEPTKLVDGVGKVECVCEREGDPG